MPLFFIAAESTEHVQVPPSSKRKRRAKSALPESNRPRDVSADRTEKAAVTPLEDVEELDEREQGDLVRSCSLLIFNYSA